MLPELQAYHACLMQSIGNLDVKFIGSRCISSNDVGMFLLCEETTKFSVCS